MSEQTNEKVALNMLRKLSVTFCLLFSASCLLPYSARAAEQKQAMVGKLSGVSGDVEVLKRGTTEWLDAANGMDIATGDQINSGIDGSAMLEFSNSKVEVKPLTQFTVGRAMEDKGQFITELYLAGGALSSKVDKNSGKMNKFSVTTPSAVCGVRGTVQDLSYEEGFGTEVAIKDGEGYTTPQDPENLPDAVQAVLGIAPAAEEGATAGATGGAAAEPGAAGSEAATAEAGPAAEPAAQFDAWLEQNFDAQVEGGGAAAAGAEEPMPIMDENSGGEEAITIADGEEASVIDPTSEGGVSTPDEIIQDDAFTDVLPASANDAELEAADISPDGTADEPPAVTQQSNDEDLADEPPPPDEPPPEEESTDPEEPGPP